MNKKNTLLVTGVTLSSILCGARKVSEYSGRELKIENPALKTAADRLIKGCVRITQAEDSVAKRAKEFFAGVQKSSEKADATVRDIQSENVLSDEAYKTVKADMEELKKSMKLLDEREQAFDQKVQECKDRLAELEKSRSETETEMKELRRLADSWNNDRENLNNLISAYKEITANIQQMQREQIRIKRDLHANDPADVNAEMDAKLAKLSESLDQKIGELKESATARETAFPAYDAEGKDKELEKKIADLKNVVQEFLNGLSKLNVPTTDAVNKSFSQINDRLNVMESNVKAVTGKLDTMAIQKAAEEKAEEEPDSDYAPSYDDFPETEEPADTAEPEAEPEPAEEPAAASEAMQSKESEAEPDTSGIQFFENDEGDRRDLHEYLGDDYSALESFVKDRFGSLVYVTTEQGRNPNAYKLSFMGKGGSYVEIGYMKNAPGDKKFVALQNN